MSSRVGIISSCCLLSVLLLAARTGAAIPVRACVTIAPQAFFVEKIAGEDAKVQILVPPGRSPHTFEPTPKQVALLSTSDVYFSIGIAPEAALLPKIRSINPQALIVRMQPELLHGGHGEGSHSAASDPHLWLSPAYAEKIAARTTDALCKLDATQCPIYQARRERLTRDLKALDERIAVLLRPFAGRTFYVAHPAFGSFAAHYGLKQVAIEQEGKEPGARELAHLIDQAREEGVTAIFVEPQSSEKSARLIAKGLGATVVTLDPLARDYPNNLWHIATALEHAFTPAAH